MSGVGIPLVSVGPAVVLAPGSSTRNLIQPTGDYIPLTLRASASQSQPLLNLTAVRSASAIDIARANNTDLGTYVFRGVYSDATEGTFSALFNDNSVFNGTNDPTMFWGYNIAPNNLRQLTSEPALMWGLEAHYRSAPTVHVMEHYLQYIDTSGNIIRPFSFVINRSTNSIDTALTTDTFNVLDRATGALWLHTATDLIQLTNTTGRFVFPNASDAVQGFNFSGSATIKMFRINTSNQIVIGQNGDQAVVGSPDSWSGTTLTVRNTSDRIGLAVIATAGQTSNLQQWNNSSNTMLSGVDVSGRFILALNAGTPTGTPATGTTVYDTTAHKLWIYDGSWRYIATT
jgi:hypothetical protein